MAAKNIVLAGDYKQGPVEYAGPKKGLRIYTGFGTWKKLYINKETVESYEVVTETNQKSMGSGIVRGAVGGALFGGIGAIAGAASGKNAGVHTVSITFKDGTRCLCALDDTLYNALITVMY